MPDANSITCTIYGLASSSDHKIRYVGQTVQRLQGRLRQHLHSPKRSKTPIAKWIKREVERGFSIEIFPIECDVILHVAECRLIAHYRKIGARLLNLTDGGEGTVGWRGNKGNKRPDLAARNRQGAGKPGHPISDESKEKIAVSKRGKKYPWLVERNKANAGKPGHKHTDESKRKIALANAGKAMSDEAKRKSSKTHKALAKKLSNEAIAKLRDGHRRYFEQKRIHAFALVEESEAS